MKRYLLFFLSILFISSFLNGEFVKLKNRSGVVIEAKILNYQNGKVRLQRNDGVTFVVSTSIFDQASISIIEQKAKESASSTQLPNPSSAYSKPRSSISKVSFSKINEAIGQKLFNDTNLWDDTADEVGGRLNWPVESATSNSISCRLYAPVDYRFLDATKGQTDLSSDRDPQAHPPHRQRVSPNRACD